MGGLPTPAEADGIWRGIWYEEAHHSTAIEGNTLVLKQVERLLDEGRAVGNKELREYLEVRGYADAADWVYRQAINRSGFSHPEEILTLAEVRNVHHKAMQPVWQVAPHPDATPRENPGSFREHDIHSLPPRHGSRHMASDISGDEYVAGQRQLPRCDPRGVPRGAGPRPLPI